jgi:F-type H+-transporting ATPase subunit alpha
MHVADQVLSLYAASKGFMDAVPVDRISEFETKLLMTLKDSHSELRDRVVAEKVIGDDLAPQLEKVIVDVRDAFLSGTAADPR